MDSVSFSSTSAVPKTESVGNATVAKECTRLKKTGMPDEAKVWKTLESIDCEIRLFPYRMQMVAFSDEATNWRVLGSFAYQKCFKFTQE